MVATAAHLTDHLLPPLPLRRWVLAVPKRLRYFLERDAALQGVALRLFLGAVEQYLRAHTPGSDRCARIGAIAFIHRFGSALNSHLHFHCVVIDGVFAPTPTGGAVFHPAIAIDRHAIATVQANVRRRLLQSFVRRGRLAQDDAQAMAQWRTVVGSRSTARCASRPPTAPGANACCVIAPAHRSPWNGCMSSVSNASSTITPNRAPAAVAR